MNSSPYLVPALAFLAAVLAGCVACAVLARIGRPGPRDRDWWDEQPPQPPAVEILTGPGAPSPQTSATLITALAQVRDAR